MPCSATNVYEHSPLREGLFTLRTVHVRSSRSSRSARAADRAPVADRPCNRAPSRPGLHLAAELEATTHVRDERTQYVEVGTQFGGHDVHIKVVDHMRSWRCSAP